MSILKVDLAVVGAGPAGLSAAALAAHHGLRTVVLDEYLTPGGRLLGQLHEERQVGGAAVWWKGMEVAARLTAEVEDAGGQLMSGVQVWGLEPGWRLHLHGGACESVSARAVVLATGACERPLPVPGWTLPGVLTVGAAQVFANVHRVRPGNRVVLCGVNALSLTVARELVMAGAEVAGIALPPAGPLAAEQAVPRAVIATLGRMAHLAPTPFLRLAGRLFPGAAGARLGALLYPRSGIRVWGVPLLLRQALTRITGDETVTGAVLSGVDADGRLLPGTEREVAVDCVALSGGLAPLVELVAAAGCRMVPSALGGLVPLHSQLMETELPGLFVAGNITGVEGARIALAQGRVAGLTAARFLGALPKPQYAALVAEARRALAETRAGAAFQFYPDTGAARARLEAEWRARIVDLAAG